MKKLLLRTISLTAATVALFVPLLGPLTWFTYSQEVPKELQKKWNINE